LIKVAKKSKGGFVVGMLEDWRAYHFAYACKLGFVVCVVYYKDEFRWFIQEMEVRSCDCQCY